MPISIFSFIFDESHFSLPLKVRLLRLSFPVSPASLVSRRFQCSRFLISPLSTELVARTMPRKWRIQLGELHFFRDDNSSIQTFACHALDLPLFWAQYPYLDMLRGIYRPENLKGYIALSDAMMGYVA